MRALSPVLLIASMTGPAFAGMPLVVATEPAPTVTPRAPSLVRGFRYGPFGVGAAMIRWRDETFFTASYQFRGDVVFRSGLAIGAELRFTAPSKTDDGDTPGIVSLLATSSHDVGRIRLHAGVGPGWISRGPGTRLSPTGTASLGADLRIARAGGSAPNLWLSARGDAGTNGMYVASFGLRLDLDFLDP